MASATLRLFNSAKELFIPVYLTASLWRKRSDDFFEARIATERVPEGHELEYSVAGDGACAGQANGRAQLLQREILFARPGRDHREISGDYFAIKGILLARQKLHRPPTFLQGSFL